MWEKKKDFYYKEQQIVIRLFSLLNYHSCENIVEKLKTGTISIRQYFGEDLTFAEKRLFAWLEQKVFWDLIFDEKRLFVSLEQKSFLSLNFRRKKIIRFVGTKKFFET